MSSVATTPPSSVPCLAGLYLALGADDDAPAPAVPTRRRALAAVAAGLLAVGMAAWPAVPLAFAGADLPAATLPDTPELPPGDAADAEG